MMSRMHFIIFFTAVALLGSCKKDMLRFGQVQQLTSHTTARLNNVRFLNDSVCIAAGGVTFDQSVMLRSVDGGYSWAATSSTDAPKEMYGMGVAPNGMVYLSGIDGDVLQSGDAGVSWQFRHIDNWLVYKGGTFPVPDTGIFVSSVLQRQCTITRVDANYKIIDEQTYQLGLNNIYMTSANEGYVIGYGTVMKTKDRGNTWAFQDVKGDNFTAMDIHGSEVWMCGSNGGIYHTYNGGDSWQTLRNGNDITHVSYMLRAILFTDSQHGWACGENGVVLYSKDGGNNWMEYEHFTSSTLRGIARCPNGDLLIVGDNGVVYRVVG